MPGRGPLQPPDAHDAWVRLILGFDLTANGGDGRAQPTQDGAPPPPTGGFFDTLKDLVADVSAAVTGSDPRRDAKQALLARLAALPDPANATDDEKAVNGKLREAIAKALSPDAPPAPNLESAGKGLEKLAQLVEATNRRDALAALDGKNPEAAKHARAAFDKFDRVLGTTVVTPELTERTNAERAAKEQELAASLRALKSAKALPDSSPHKRKAVEDATALYRTTQSAADALAARADAMLGQSSLTQAISHGPLSAETGNPFKDPKTAEKLIAAYAQDARMADAAVTAAATAKFPDAVADNVGPMIARAQNGFAAGSGQSFDNRATAQKYGADLLKVGGAVGPEYFAGLPGYIASGQQFSPDGSGDAGAATFTQLAQQRSVKLAGAMVKPDGGIDVESSGAKAAIGNVLYHPDAMRNQTPALAAHVLKTVDLFKDFTTGRQANAVLKFVGTPTNPAAQALVRGSLAKGATDPVDATAARTSVLAAMLKPLDQGPVGSCFATAPARRMRETQPIDAMRAYAGIASKGTYRPASGAELPAVTNVPPGEDPIMRSWEYTAATAAARDGSSYERAAFTGAVGAGTEMLKSIAVKGEAAKDKDISWAYKKQKLANDVAAAFTFTYDSTAKIVSSSDGKSSQGRFVVQRAGGAAITNQADFEAAITDVALGSLGIDKASPEAAEIAAKVRDPAFIAAVCPGDYKPWALAGGGFSNEAMKTVFGGTVTTTPLLGAAGTPLPAEGKRTEQVLASLLKGFKGDPSPMITVDTVGQHSFNALPNDPSLAPLKGADDAETARNLQSKLIDKGQAMKDTELGAERAGWLFDQAVDAERKAEKDATLQALIDAEAAKRRPKAAMKPAALAALVQQALEAYHDKPAEQRAAKWKGDEAAGGRAVADDKLAGKKAEIKQALTDYAQAKAKTALMKDLGAPEFVIADSNWGDSRNHVFFVVAPDPTTGEPLLWEKTEPPGSMRPAGREWVDKEWASVR